MASLTAYTGSVPQHYETYLGPLFFEPYALDLAERIPSGRFNQLLELAAGTGRLTRYLLPKLVPGGKLLATDLNEGMLAIGRALLPDDRIGWQVADAHRLPFEGESMDAAVCQFGVMFFADKPAAFAEVFRVLKPGGSFYFNTWDHLQYNALSQAARRVMDELFPDDPPPFLEKGPYSFWEPNAVRQTVQAAGFVDVQLETVRLAGSCGSVDDCVAGIVDGTPIAGYLHERNMPAETVKEKIKLALEQYRSGTVYVLPMQAHVCIAMKP